MNFGQIIMSANHQLSKKGVTLVELMVAMTVSLILLGSIYKAYSYFTVAAEKEKKKALIIKDITIFNQQLEKDIRMAGYGLPGNGIRVTQWETYNDGLQIYTNMTKTSTKLVHDVYSSHYIFRVVDATNFINGGYVCLCPTIPGDTVYRRIDRVGMNSTGTDTIYLAQYVSAGPYYPASTNVLPCTRFKYKINTTLKRAERWNNGTILPLSKLIDTINITAKNSSGTVISGNNSVIRELTITVAGRIKNGNKITTIMDSTTATIKNRE